jgi:ABC-type lipoprotein release transport system permease subunit
MRAWIEKQRNMVDFTLSALLRRKGKNVALMAVYTAVVFVLGSVMFFAEGMRREAHLILHGSPEIIVQKMVAGRHDLIPVAYMEKIRQIKGVQSVRERLWGYYYDPVVGANYTLLVPEDFALGEGNIAIGKGISRKRLAYEGDILSFRGYGGEPLTFQIGEIFSAASELVSTDLVTVSEQDFRGMFAMPKEVATDLVVKARNPKELATIATKIVQLLPDTRPILRDEILRTYDAVFSWRSSLMLVILSGAVFSFIILAWDKATGMSAEEKREVGILKAVGWETADVLLMRFWEGVVVSASAFMLGVLLAYGHVFLASAMLFEPVLKGWSVLYPEFKISPFIAFNQVAALFFLTVVPYTVATIVPSWRTATIDPDSVMRM